MTEATRQELEWARKTALPWLRNLTLEYARANPHVYSNYLNCVGGIERKAIAELKFKNEKIIKKNN